MKPLKEEFGDRLTTLSTGALGLRGGLACMVRSVTGADDVVEFVGSDGSVDRYNEVIDQKGWQLENFRANPVIPDCHDYSSIVKILGRAQSVEVKDGQLVNRVQFCMDNPLGLLAYKMAKGGFIKSQSVGFIPLEWTNGVGKDMPDRTYTKAELLEISLVVVPANPGATIGNQIKSVLTGIEHKALHDFLKHICSDNQPDPEGQGSASASGVHDAQLLQLARDLSSVLRRA